MRSFVSMVLGFVAAVVGGAVGGLLLWNVVDRMFVMNGRGLLVRAGWPLDQPTLFAAAGAAANALGVAVARARGASTTAALAEAAERLGLAFEGGEVTVPPGDRPNVPLFLHWDRCRERMTGTTGGAPAQMFDLTTADRGGEGRSYQAWTVVLFRETDLPAFTCLPKTLTTLPARSLTTSVDFDSSEGTLTDRAAATAFMECYQLSLIEPDDGTGAPSTEEGVRHLFRAPRLEALAASPGWYVQSADGCLVLARRGTAPASAREWLWTEAGAIRRALVAPVSSAVMAIPAAPGRDRGRQQALRTGRVLGGLAGGIVGFFGGFMAFVSVLFGKKGMPGAVVFAAFPAAVFGALTVGATLGVLIGGWLAGRAYRPETAGTPPVKVGGGWLVGGAFIGWGVGIAIGMGLIVIIDPRRVADWAAPLLFFTPPITCLVLGGFAGYRVGRRRAVVRASLGD